MSTEITFFVSSSVLVDDLQSTFTILQQESPCDGWIVYHTDQFDIGYCHKRSGCGLPYKTGSNSPHLCYAVEENYEKLQDWAGGSCRTIWINRNNVIPSAELPSHDYELERISQLEEICHIGQSPSLSQCLTWWEEWNLPANVRRHVTKVAWAAYALAVMLRAKGIEVNPILTHRGGLLHDLDKIKTLNMVNSHGNVGASFLDAQGYPAVAEIVRGHILHTILDPTSDNRPWEVKLVYFCDKLTEGDRIVPLEERFAALGKRYPAYMKKMERAKTHVWGLNNTICSILSIPDNDHLVSLLNTLIKSISPAQ
jgi:putative nucleotidyltransferase with HDIG domain